MSLLDKTKQECNFNNIKPSRSRGQNFLVKENIYNEIINCSELTKNDVVLEVGPGLGYLTQKIASKVKKVYSIELDDKLAALLGININKEKINNVEVVNMNILDFDFYELGYTGKYKIVANLPYNITSIFLRKFLSDFSIKPDMFVLMLQKEVVQRIAAKAGKMSLLAVSVQYYANVEVILNVAKEDFWPIPQVDSAIIKIKRKLDLKNDKVYEKKFFKLVKAGFSSKRKMLKNNLSNFYKYNSKEITDILIKNGQNEKARAQDLSLEEWKSLCEYF